MSDDTTTRPRRWGKAGVRLDTREARAEAGQRGLDRLKAQQATDRAHAAWKRGHLVPWRITTALDIRKLYGPEVDRALGVEEPTVDEWEAGETYPSWEQVLALAVLTGFPVAFFAEPVKGPPIRAEDTSLRFHMPKDLVDDEPLPVLSFKPEAIRARLGHEGRPVRELRSAKALAAENEALRRRLDSAVNWLSALDQIAAGLEDGEQQIAARRLRQAASGLRQTLERPPRAPQPPGKRA